MKKIFFVIAVLPAALFAQKAMVLTPIQAAVINDDPQEIDNLAAQGADWLFIRKPDASSEGELLLDFALANGKMKAFQYFIGKGAAPGINTLFAAVKSRRYDLAKELVEADSLKAYGPAAPPGPRYVISNEIQTNIRAVFNTNLITNVVQFAVTNAIGELNIRDYTNYVPFISTNFYTNIQTRIFTNKINAAVQSLALPPEPIVSFAEITNRVPVTLTNYTNTYQKYTLSNERGQSMEREYTNSVPIFTEAFQTSITRRPVTNIVNTPHLYSLRPATLNRLHFIDLARLAESQNNRALSSYFLEKARTLES